MIDRSTNIQAALRSRQRGFLLNPFRFAPAGPADPADPYWSNVQLLLHFDGLNGSTTFTDSSSSPKTVAAGGEAKLSSGQARFGPTSLLPFSGTGGHASVTHVSALEPGSQDFCVEFSAYPTSIPSNAILFNKRVGTASGYPFQCVLTTTGALIFRSYAVGEALVFSATTEAGVVTTNAWHHLAFCRVGTNFYVYVNGVQRATTTYSGDLPSNTDNMQIGAYSDSGFGFSGYMDEFRYTVGNGRYPSAFTPPAAPFPNS